MSDVFTNTYNSLSDQAGEVVEDSLCGAWASGAAAMTMLGTTAGTAGVGAVLGVGAGIVVGSVVYKGCKKFGLGDELRGKLKRSLGD